MTRTAAHGEVKNLENVHDLLRTFAGAAARIYLPKLDKFGNPHLGRFIFDNGRLPFINDDPKPWTFRGWLIPYVQMCEAHPLVAKRYDYVLRTLGRGRLLDEPLPEIGFASEYDPATRPGIAMLKKCLDRIEYESGWSNGMRELCEWIGFALGVTTGVSKLAADVQEFLYRTFNLEPLLLQPSDYLGLMLSETNHGKRNGFFPTPINICELMIRLTSGDKTGDRRGELMSDPCVGTGRMLLVASNYSMRLFGQDLDYLCCLITKINLALYAPWHHVPDSYFPAKTENTIISLPAAENGAQGKGIEPQTADQPPPESEIERLRAEKQRLDAARRKDRKIYTTDIDQPTLF